MATKPVYITIRLDMTYPSTKEITDEKIQEIINEMNYRFEWPTA